MRPEACSANPLEAIHYDTRSDIALYRQYADRLLTEDAVGVIVGCCTSLSRKAVLPSIERRNGLLWYPDLYEGFEYSPNVIYVDAATNQNSLPLARYLFRRGARRFLLIGSDYIYPREANRVMRDLIERHGGEVLDEIYLPMRFPRALWGCRSGQPVRRLRLLRSAPVCAGARARRRDGHAAHDGLRARPGNGSAAWPRGDRRGNNHTWMTPRVGVWNGVDEFDLVWESDQVVQPDPWLVSYGGVENIPDTVQAAG